MLRSVRRALTAAAAVSLTAATLLAGAPAASAATVIPYACAQESSTRLLTGDIAGTPYYAWVQPVSSSETWVCFGTYPYDLVVVVHSGFSLTPPGVVNTPGAGSCSIEIVDLVDPVAIQASLGYSTAPTLCLGLEDETTTLSLTGVAINTLPDVEVWRGEGDIFVCVPQYALWQADGGEQSGSAYYNYDRCLDDADQVL